ncbi:MAG TPA: DNA polymerase III subunit delta, partial [Buchnera sp. (in: enterobacteria)]|nr:DNA polymerase III subunit delta [Buchnera sp. (in: enterobacteria)]
MIKIYTENLSKILKTGLQPCYMLIGNEEYLMQDNQDTLLFFAKKQGFYEQQNIIINIDEDWKKIISIYKNHSFFFQKKIVVITYKLLNNINYFIEKLKKIYYLFNKNIFLIIKLDKKLSSYYQYYTNNVFKLSIPIIFCYTLNIQQWIHWVNNKIDILKLHIHTDVKKILYRNYEGNLLEISNILKIFALLYPHKIIKYDDIKNIIEHLAIFV